MTKLTSSALSALPRIADFQEQIVSVLHDIVNRLTPNQLDLTSNSLPLPLPPRDCKDIMELQRHSTSNA